MPAELPPKFEIEPIPLEDTAKTNIAAWRRVSEGKFM